MKRFPGFVAAEVTRLKFKKWSLLTSAATMALAISVLVVGCASKSSERLREQNAYLAGQNAALQQQQSQLPGVTVIGAVQQSHVPWVAGLTLAQAIATADYVGQDEPKHIIITRNGESAALDASVLLNGTNIPLEIGDVIELQ